jgi:hypothetical protein
MSPLSGPVLGASALVASPALWSALDGSMPMDVALTRYLFALGICWALISLVTEFALPGPEAVRAEIPDGVDEASGDADPEHAA